MFYCGRPVRRLTQPLTLPEIPELTYCILTELEWKQFADDVTVLKRLLDSQGEDVLLVKKQSRDRAGSESTLPDGRGSKVVEVSDAWLPLHLRASRC